MQIALGADDDVDLVAEIARYLEAAGHTVDRYGSAGETKEAWASAALMVADRIVEGTHLFGIVCCYTGTGASIAANKVPGIRAALCGDAETARGARKWNDANVLALSLRATSAQIAREILEAWLSEPYAGTEDASLIAIRDREAHSSAEPSRSSAR